VRGKAAVRHRHTGLCGTAPGGAVQTRFEPKPKFKRDQIDFKFLQILMASNITMPDSKNLKQNMVGKHSRQGTSLLIEISSDSKCILI
jgi:hypothetical protein